MKVKMSAAAGVMAAFLASGPAFGMTNKERCEARGGTWVAKDSSNPEVGFCYVTLLVVGESQNGVFSAPALRPGDYEIHVRSQSPILFSVAVDPGKMARAEAAGFETVAMPGPDGVAKIRFRQPFAKTARLALYVGDGEAGLPEKPQYGKNHQSSRSNISHKPGLVSILGDETRAEPARQ